MLETDGTVEPVTINTPCASPGHLMMRGDMPVQVLTFGRCSVRPQAFLRELLLSGSAPQRVPDNISDVPTEKSETLSESSPDECDADDVNRIVAMALRDLEDALASGHGVASHDNLQLVAAIGPPWAHAARHFVSNNAHNIAVAVVGGLVGLYLLRLVRSRRRSSQFCTAASFAHVYDDIWR